MSFAKFSKVTGLCLGVLIFGTTKAISACPLAPNSQFYENCQQNSSEFPDEEVRQLNQLNHNNSLGQNEGSWSSTFTIWGSSSQESNQPIVNEESKITERPEYKIEFPKATESDIEEFPSLSNE